jgi:hypothetical protein
MKTKVTDFEVVDHGIDGSQYFQGCGVALTRYEHVATGCGDNFREALDDCLEMMAQSDDIANLESLIVADIDAYGKESVPEDSEDTYYYVSIRYNTAKETV